MQLVTAYRLKTYVVDHTNQLSRDVHGDENTKCQKWDWEWEK